MLMDPVPKTSPQTTANTNARNEAMERLALLLTHDPMELEVPMEELTNEELEYAILRLVKRSCEADMYTTKVR